MRVFAYLDPGSGSMILQTILGGFAAVVVSVKMFGKRVFRTLTFWRDHDEDESPTTTSSTSSSAEQHETEKEPV
jgi:hypothetical protein